MVGHRSERYLEFGWASARIDDLLNLPGSRLTAVLAADISRRLAEASTPGATTLLPATQSKRGPVKVRPSPARSACHFGWSAPTATAPSTATSSAPAAPPNAGTSPTPPTSPDASTWPLP